VRGTKKVQGAQPKKKFLKSFQKPLDKTTKMWYNIYVRGREVHTLQGSPKGEKTNLIY
jgi:hypothetical protein